MTIGFFEIITQEEKDYFSKMLPNHDLFFFSHPLNHQNLEEAHDFELVSTFVNCRVDAKTLDALPNLKAVFARSTGIDVIDITYAKQKGIKVYNVPTYGSHTVAEFTFALILALLRNIPQAVERTKEDGLFSFEGLRGFDLHGKTLGVIGTGRIGENVVKIARGFGMNVIAYDLYPKEELIKSYGVKYATLENLLGNSNIITLHAPYTKENHHIINKDNITLIRPGSYIINTARGALIDTHVLFEALKHNYLAGAALDVLEEEQSLKEEAELLSSNAMSNDEYRKILEDHLLLRLPNVIVTPHLAFYSKEAQESIIETVVENVKAFVSGSDVNLVNK